MGWQDGKKILETRLLWLGRDWYGRSGECMAGNSNMQRDKTDGEMLGAFIDQTYRCRKGRGHPLDRKL